MFFNISEEQDLFVSGSASTDKNNTQYVFWGVSVTARKLMSAAAQKARKHRIFGEFLHILIFQKNFVQ